jgi:hypothetical protein
VANKKAEMADEEREVERRVRRAVEREREEAKDKLKRQERTMQWNLIAMAKLMFRPPSFVYLMTIVTCVG